MLVSLVLFSVLMSCNDNDNSNEIEAQTSYGTMPMKFDVIKIWFAENSATAPMPPAATKIAIEQGNQVELDHGIGAHYYDISINDYFSGGLEYDVEFYLTEDIKIIAVVVNDILVGNSDSGYAVAEAKLMEDYKGYNVGEIIWSTQRSYQLATFNISTKAVSKSITAWYSVNGDTATREMDSENLGVVIPDVIRSAFEATVYSDASLWVIEEIELERSYNSNSIDSYYEVDLVSKVVPQLEAELFFNATTGVLLTSKEDTESRDDDKFVVNAELKAAVEKAVPGATIIDADVDDNIIEVDVIVTTGGVLKEVELEFTMAYVLISSEIETEYTYGQLPAQFNTINDWFANNAALVPTPSAMTLVEITEGNQTEADHNIGAYYYNVEIDDYISGVIEYEVEFYLDEKCEITSVIVNDVKQLNL